MTSIPATTPLPQIRSLTREDVTASLKAGLNDFQRAPVYGLFFGAVFSVVGIAITWALFLGDASYWILPFAAGFPLIGPFAAVGLYEVSRRLEAGEELSWGPILKAGFRQNNSQLPFFAVLTVFGFLFWIVLARVIFAISFGTATMTNVMTSLDVYFTAQGLTMLVVGTVIGAALAALLFSISVVGVPMLMDRDIDVVTAMISSVKAVVENREAMIFWGLMVAIAVFIAMLPLFLGMVLVFPILGHASWHIYRKAVEPAS
ncbi:DUF2189 domain-containing protein [Pontivivens ytuae]|uniref:DUF2189 domain-containing protein n=1 Tax=Pontivivens ytuae TaxID=2789856 RepID=A0A7S9LT55_9RHOB|nr:DUF2189 domain-containing protein [Pontivivens ytuae]QPH54819.1 DUF2189 domain-containing protein [Pontivivens ytuae]